MAEPNQGLSLDEAAARLMEPVDPPQSEPSDEVEKPIEASEEVVQESEDSAEVEATEVETEEVETKEAEAPDETQTFLTDLNDWMKENAEAFENIKVPKKVNGEIGEVALSELIANHQIEQASEERLNKLKAEKAEFEAKKAKSLETFNNQLSQATQLVNLLEQQFTKDFESVNWDELRETDPAEYSARRQDLLEKQQQLNGAKQSISAEQQSRVVEQYNEILQRESQALMEVFPAWADEAVAKQEKSQIREYLMAQGFTPQEVDGATDQQGNLIASGIVDHRAIKLAQKAMLYDKGQQNLDVAKKKVAKVPKVAKPGSQKTQSDDDVEKQKKMRGRLKKTGNLDDAAALIRQSMFGG